MRLKFDKYWEEYSDILSIVAVLDPRLKFAALEYCYDVLDPFTSKSKVDHIRKKIKKLYGVYKKDRKSTTASPSETQLVNSIPAGYGEFYAFFSSKEGRRKSALDVYLVEPVLDMAAFMTIDVLRYWKKMQHGDSEDEEEEEEKEKEGEKEGGRKKKKK
ncbi:PREDICTED: zinc finger BED domain-containing protein DAYSLEEPER-like [Brassica oleracea var. oleracea]|uniref:zinc finger BED domain-containing protein DAYSLEEPER-like n=1 Tax=Brassica oleracea var. oleracea TaxID=109376 RepID=UPI0006A6B7DD|nr:PREDICTED: zinc finger BED domain-containing protein DAYSLEEPER-like [Brassica oleracea var. oleracea]